MMVEHEMNGQSVLTSQWIEHPCLRGLQHHMVELMNTLHHFGGCVVI